MSLVQRLRVGTAVLLASAAISAPAFADGLEPLSATERKTFMRMMQRVIVHHGELARSDPPGG